MGDRAGEDSVITRRQITEARKRCSSEEECLFAKCMPTFISMLPSMGQEGSLNGLMRMKMM